MAPALQRDNEFWQFSLAVYASPGVAAECLALQDSLGIDVNLMLFCAWLGSARRIVLTGAQMERARNLVQPWQDEAVRPLRAVRRALKAVGGTDTEAFRTRVKGLELEAEQIEQAMLFAHAAETWPRVVAGDATVSVPANIRTFLELGGNAGHVADEALPARHLVDAALRIGR